MQIAQCMAQVNGDPTAQDTSLITALRMGPISFTGTVTMDTRRFSRFSDFSWRTDAAPFPFWFGDILGSSNHLSAVSIGSRDSKLLCGLCAGRIKGHAIRFCEGWRLLGIGKNIAKGGYLVTPGLASSRIWGAVFESYEIRVCGSFRRIRPNGANPKSHFRSMVGDIWACKVVAEWPFRCWEGFSHCSLEGKKNLRAVFCRYHGKYHGSLFLPLLIGLGLYLNSSLCVFGVSCSISTYLFGAHNESLKRRF